jgi:hypothetical protein
MFFCVSLNDGMAVISDCDNVLGSGRGRFKGNIWVSPC